MACGFFWKWLLRVITASFLYTGAYLSHHADHMLIQAGKFSLQATKSSVEASQHEADASVVTVSDTQVSTLNDSSRHQSLSQNASGTLLGPLNATNRLLGGYPADYAALQQFRRPLVLRRRFQKTAHSPMYAF